MHDSLIIHGKVNQRDCDILLDTGASKSILRRDFLVEKTLKNPDKYALKTATGEQARAYGEIEVDIQLGNTSVMTPTGHIRGEQLSCFITTTTPGFKLGIEEFHFSRT
ncbi:hypothetical protein M8J77_019539 [Diaphorina citri]|nr:hypothetical protein M8J77_019539 [Diaphorina citri]